MLHYLHLQAFLSVSSLYEVYTSTMQDEHGTVSMAMLGKLLGWSAYGHFRQVHRYHLKQSRTEGKTSNEMAANRCHLYYKCGLCKEPDV